MKCISKSKLLNVLSRLLNFNYSKNFFIGIFKFKKKTNQISTSSNFSKTLFRPLRQMIHVGFVGLKALKLFFFKHGLIKILNVYLSLFVILKIKLH